MQNFIKTIINGVQSWTKGKIKELDNRYNKRIIESTADWEQNDSSADNYVKNRTHWEEDAVINFLDNYFVNLTIPCDNYGVPEGWYYETIDSPFDTDLLKVGEKYTIMLDNVEYEETLRLEESGLCFGKELPYYFSGPDVPYGIVISSHNHLHLSAYGSGWHSFSIRGSGKLIHKLDSKYLPTNLATTDDVQEAVDGKMDANNPVGTGSFSMNRKADTTVGEYSNAIGHNAEASGYGSTAIGNVTASRRYTTVLGTFNIKDTDTYGTQGNTSDYDFHIRNIMSGTVYYVGTGYTFNPHTGTFNLHNPELVNVNDSILPYNSSFFGCESSDDPQNLTYIYSTDKIYWRSQSGYYFFEAERRVSTTDTKMTRGKYALIVGNGVQYFSNLAARLRYSNAHTLDWNGVGWFQGGLQVGGNAQDDGARNVLLEGEALQFKKNVNITMPPIYIYHSIAYGNGKFVGVGYCSSSSDNIFAYSDNGIDWIPINVNLTNDWASVAYGNGKFVAISGGTKKSTIVVYSEDGINWIRGNLIYANHYQSLTFGNGKFVAVSGMYNNKSSNVVYSEDGINWIQTTMPTKEAWNLVAYGDGKFVALNTTNSNIAAYSEDGINWTQTSCVAGQYISIAYGNGKFVALDSENNAIIYSDNGTDWQKVDLLIASEFNEVFYGNNKFVITCGYNSNIAAYSEDGINWTQTTMPFEGHSIGTYGNDMFIVVSTMEKKVACSNNGIDWYEPTYEAIYQNDINRTEEIRDLLLDGYVVPTPTSAEIGQTLVVKSVDKNGKPIEWECVDAPESGENIDLTGYVQSVNGISPDENGNVDVVGGSGCDVSVEGEKLFITDDAGFDNIFISGATVGQTIKIAEVDINGVPTAWEAIDIPGEEVYELIETIVCDGTYGIINKKDLNLKYVKIYLNTKAASAANSVCIEAYNESGLFGYAWMGNCINTAERWTNVYIVSDGKNAYIEYTSPAAANYNTGNMLRTSGRMNADTPINKISIYASGSGILIPEGSTIEIWGVRA